MKVLANNRRLAILHYLKQTHEAAVWDIAGEIRLSFKATSKHLGILYAAGIVEKEQRNVMMYYTLAHSLHPVTKFAITTL
ncbi:hypothetical protein A3J33_02130 [candidate division WWE3 bacterium RIFCSPLOWO2_02_FULL_53_10]|uniref:HTH arsR-type domain-containing protein n=1 Tax=candidate division WWE3 bacterium RIFCSPLOWO2_02_FULL_53_10 TaxID=1802629 RepID=A0A1F4WGC8_UNCKA|nr:MAG: hypothetical protein A3J33_02130 [candidate division WWE3 bacterium RIFCSPLOWO2_02_FULL_53_10]